MHGRNRKGKNPEDDKYKRMRKDINKGIKTCFDQNKIQTWEVNNIWRKSNSFETRTNLDIVIEDEDMLWSKWDTKRDK